MRPRRDIDDIDSLFDQEEATARRRRRAEMIAANEQQERETAAKEAEAKKRVADFSKKATESIIRAEYRAQGVEPRPGVLVSLQLLFRMGWTIQDLEAGGRSLVAPPVPKYQPQPKRECS